MNVKYKTVFWILFLSLLTIMIDKMSRKFSSSYKKIKRVIFIIFTDCLWRIGLLPYHVRLRQLNFYGFGTLYIVKGLQLSYYLPIAGDRIGFMAFSRETVQSKCQLSEPEFELALPILSSVLLTIKPTTLPIIHVITKCNITK